MTNNKLDEQQAVERKNVEIFLFPSFFVVLLSLCYFVWWYARPREVISVVDRPSIFLWTIHAFLLCEKFLIPLTLLLPLVEYAQARESPEFFII